VTGLGTGEDAGARLLVPQPVLVISAANPRGASLGAPGAAALWGENVPVLPVPLLTAAGRQDPPMAVASPVSLRFGWCLLPPDNASSRSGRCWWGGKLLAGARPWVGCAGRGLLFGGIAKPM